MMRLFVGIFCLAYGSARESPQQHTVSMNKRAEVVKHAAAVRKDAHLRQTLSEDAHGDRKQEPLRPAGTKKLGAALESGYDPTEPGCYYREVGSTPWILDTWGPHQASHRSWSNQSACEGRKSGHDAHNGGNSEWLFVEYTWPGLVCPTSCQCSAGGATDGGKPLNANGYCEHICSDHSHGSYCGEANALYMTGSFTDCTSCASVAALEFTPEPQSDASPLTNETSKCRALYRNDGPVAKQSLIGAGYSWKDTFEKQVIHYPESDVYDKTGVAWAVGYKHGCTRVLGGSGEMNVCGCYEIWCPMRETTINHPDDMFGRASSCTADAASASSCDNTMAVRNTCYSSRAVFGCFKNDVWHDFCGEQQAGTYEPGAGTKSGMFVPNWENLVF